MTRRERLEMVINGNITTELIEDCKVELEKLNASNANRKQTPHQIENEKIANEILTVLTSENKFVDEILPALTDKELARQRVSGILGTLVKKGSVISEDVKVKGKGIRKAYRLA